MEKEQHEVEMVMVISAETLEGIYEDLESIEDVWKKAVAMLAVKTFMDNIEQHKDELVKLYYTE